MKHTYVAYVSEAIKARYVNCRYYVTSNGVCDLHRIWPEIDVVLYRTCSVRTAKNHFEGDDNQDLNSDSKRVFTLSGTFQFRIS
jgi:hypothetical protein